MKARAKMSAFITLELRMSEEEAKCLMGMVQNPSQGYEDNEDEIQSHVREQIFNGIVEILRG